MHHHLTLHFAQLFIYFDEPSELAGLPSGVTGLAVDEALRVEWSRLGSVAEDWLGRADQEVQARQALNALHAVGLCHAGEHKDLNIAWLLHLDADELFYPGPGVLDVRPHFASLGELGAHAFTVTPLSIATITLGTHPLRTSTLPLRAFLLHPFSFPCIPSLSSPLRSMPI